MFRCGCGTGGGDGGRFAGDGGELIWVGPDEGAFRTPQFWIPFSISPPILGPGGANDTANFNRGFTPADRYTVNTVFGVNERLLVHNDASALVLSDNYSLVGTSSSDASFVVGTTSGGTGDVNLNGSGTLHSQHNSIGDVAGSSGTVRLRGLSWTIHTGILRVGNLGEGTLMIQSGAVVTNVGGAAISGNIGGSAGSTGSVTVSGLNSTWTNNGILNVGVSGTGSMTISGGGKVINGTGNIGTGSSGVGNVSVTGNGSQWMAIPGDANLDGAVTIADLGILAGNWQGSGKTWTEADFNGDGMVTITDLGILAGHWQQGAGGMGMSFEEAVGMFDVFDGVVVPEPAAIGLIVLAGLFALRRRR